MTLFQKKGITPELLKEVDKPFNDPNYLYEIKFDGIRAMIYVSKYTFKIVNRHGEIITHLYPELKEIQKNILDEVIFDGEIIALEKGLPSFSKLQLRSHLKKVLKIEKMAKENPVVFICFDLLYLNKDLTKESLIERKKILNKFKDTKEFVKSIYVIEKGKELFKTVKKKGLEGIVAKKISSPYLINTRSDNWVKIKNLKKELFRIGSYKENISSPLFVVTLLDLKKNIVVGHISIPKKDSLYLKVKKKEKNLTCFVKYLERTKDNKLRQPIYIREK